MVECVEKGRTTITLSSTSLGKDQGTAHEFAIRNAFENILFKGIPNSNQEKPIIANEITSREDHQAFYNNFFQNAEYRKFILDNYIENSYKSNGGTNVNSIIKIDLGAFKKHLEQSKITKKFGL